MDDNTIDVEVVQVEIVRCPRCGSRNRLLKQEKPVSYRCGGCATPLKNPFTPGSIIKRRFQEIARRVPPRALKYIVAFVVAILAMIVILRKPNEVPKPASTFAPTVTPAVTPTPTVPPTPTLNNSLPPPSINSQPSLPPREESESPPNSLANGTILNGFKGNGIGRLTIQNDTDRDAVVKLVNEAAKYSVVTVYVTAYNSAVVNQIPEGNFTALFSQGIDWDDDTHTFKRMKSFWKFDQNMDFITKVERSGNQIIHRYKDIALELAPSLTGNATRSKVSEKTFSEY